MISTQSQQISLQPRPLSSQSQPVTQSSLKANRLTTNSQYGGRQSIRTQSSYQDNTHAPPKSKVGTVTFKPLEYRFNQNFKTTDRIDPYCKFKIGWSSVKTPAAKSNGLHPTWTGGQGVTLRTKDHDYAKIKLKNKDKFFGGNIGKAKIMLAPIVRSGKVTQWIPLMKGHKQAGQILIEIVFTPHITGMY